MSAPGDVHGERDGGTAPVTPRQLQEQYTAGANISKVLRTALESAVNTEQIIEIAYDLQAGSYRRGMDDPATAAMKVAFGAAVAAVIDELGPVSSLLEAGVGEATSLASVVQHLSARPGFIRGFDISWSRVAHARVWLASQGIDDVELCTGSLLDLPCADAGADVVLTVHAVEPNGGREREILRELYRAARKWLVLLEPGYELASTEARHRMEEHGYCRGLPDLCRELGYDVVRHELFPFSANPHNPTALILIRKPHTTSPSAPFAWACPRYKTPLVPVAEGLFSPEALAVYPVLQGIPCLRVDNAIVASQFPDFAGSEESAP